MILDQCLRKSGEMGVLPPCTDLGQVPGPERPLFLILAPGGTQPSPLSSSRRLMHADTSSSADLGIQWPQFTAW